MLFPQVDGRQLLVEASDGGQVTAIVPLVRYASLFLRLLQNLQDELVSRSLFTGSVEYNQPLQI
jgi:hypothetical protein